MSTLAHILIVDLGRHLEWFLELAPIEYIMFHILYIIIELKIKEIKCKTISLVYS